ncbi:tRNA uridine-5-carboxymethylaminomethyl(34) synthesis GTPase MnmE [Pseudovibrio sp. SPO723]|uniref:tRNA uridine-5-carboxymethylaminomethyl(34) synthesis GTPase MnmE n=1 Tax=Nesiotobacter zosterae TaxID=392721 RepID=UPI0029C16CB3|nr:tRNA uridine-5-carboxymethylaminomethyl(34) synthesis GTPase MnmE [Pseudovibrio sp. SPO723]MDX5595125.1 tRNA uridine-5-carboxymethylaminomethyl(34) synthesis GTPase MnmE [Pseudovibrio sp. SPO723]
MNNLSAGRRDTIFALSSGALPSGVAVIRLSGPQSRDALRLLIKGKFPVSRESSLRKLYHPVDGSVLDEALVLWFEGPNSFTGEDTVELHCHGGRAVVSAVLRALSEMEGLRPAEQGEYTRRAFHNGKLDLTEVEGLADLIDAETEAQRRQAQRQMSGALGELYNGWRESLIRSRAFIEAELDFADEEDVPDSVSDEVWSKVSTLKADIEAHLSDARRGERLRSGLVVVLLGPPNAGKSSLMNKLARRDVAIVTPEAGTTRDVLEVHLDLGGYPVTLIDTAGLRENAGLVEREGIKRALASAENADLILWTQGLDGISEPLPEHLKDGAAKVWIVKTKADLAAGVDPVKGENLPFVYSSTHSDDGMDALLAKLTAFAEENIGNFENPLITRERYRSHLSLCVEALDRAIAGAHLPLELRSEELRMAAEQLGRITGRIDVEDLLDVIFRDFCIGK